MPPLPAVPQVFKCVIEGNNGAYGWANILHFSYTGGPPSTTDAFNIASAIFNAFTVFFNPLMVAESTITSVTLTDLSSATSAEATFSGSVVGTLAGVMIGGNSALLLSFSIDVRYRGGHPRIYLALGSDLSLADAGHWTTDFVNLATTAWSNFADAAIDDGISGSTALASQVIVSYISKEINPVPPYRRTVPVVYPVPTGISAGHTELSSQRRRIGRK